METWLEDGKLVNTGAIVGVRVLASPGSLPFPPFPAHFSRHLLNLRRALLGGPLRAYLGYYRLEGPW